MGSTRKFTAAPNATPFFKLTLSMNSEPTSLRSTLTPSLEVYPMKSEISARSCVAAGRAVDAKIVAIASMPKVDLLTTPSPVTQCEMSLRRSGLIKHFLESILQSVNVASS